MSELLRLTSETICEAAHGTCACKLKGRPRCAAMERAAGAILGRIAPIAELELLYAGKASIRRKARRKGPAPAGLTD